MVAEPRQYYKTTRVRDLAADNRQLIVAVRLLQVAALECCIRFRDYGAGI